MPSPSLVVFRFTRRVRTSLPVTLMQPTRRASRIRTFTSVAKLRSADVGGIARQASTTTFEARTLWSCRRAEIGKHRGDHLNVRVTPVRLSSRRLLLDRCGLSDFEHWSNRTFHCRLVWVLFRPCHCSNRNRRRTWIRLGCRKIRDPRLQDGLGIGRRRDWSRVDDVCPPIGQRNLTRSLFWRVYRCGGCRCNNGWRNSTARSDEHACPRAQHQTQGNLGACRQRPSRCNWRHRSAIDGR